jgi:hypothetical protein
MVPLGLWPGWETGQRAESWIRGRSAECAKRPIDIAKSPIAKEGQTLMSLAASAWKIRPFTSGFLRTDPGFWDSPPHDRKDRVGLRPCANPQIWVWQSPKWGIGAHPIVLPRDTSAVEIRRSPRSAGAPDSPGGSRRP